MQKQDSLCSSSAERREDIASVKQEQDAIINRKEKLKIQFAKIKISKGLGDKLVQEISQKVEQKGGKIQENHKINQES